MNQLLFLVDVLGRRMASVVHPNAFARAIELVPLGFLRPSSQARIAATETGVPRRAISSANCLGIHFFFFNRIERLFFEGITYSVVQMTC